MIKNIVIVTSYFAPAWSYGGPPKVLYTLGKELVRLGKTVKVITTDALDEKRNNILKEKIDGIEIFRFKTISNTLAYKLKIFISAGILEGAKDILEKADFILFSDVRSIINWQIFPFVEKKKIPYGIFAFGEIPYGSGLKTLIKKKFDRWWVNDFIKNASLRFAQTAHEQEMYRQVFHIPLSETQLLPLPVEACHPDQVPIQSGRVEGSLANASKKWGIKNDDKVLLFVGRLHYLKGVDILLNATSPLFKRDKNLKLLIVGRDDGEESKLQNLVDPKLKKQVIFIGALYEKDVYYAYSLASCFVITPRFYEETSLAALTALSFGVPAVVSRQAEVPYLEEYKAGFVVDNDPKIIQKAIIKLLEKIKEDKSQLRVNAQKLIADKFSATMIAKDLLSIMDKN